MKICSIENCDGDVIARGWCGKHYSRWHSWGDPEAPSRRGQRPSRSVKICSVEGCDKEHESRGFCRTHYSRWKRRGDPLQVTLVRGRNGTKDNPVECSEIDCEYPARSCGLCNHHYRNQMHAKRGECSVEGCETKWMAQGLCGKHYNRQRSWGTTDDPRPSPLRGSCSADDCDDPIKARKLCGLHLRRWYVYGTTELPLNMPERKCGYCKQKLPANQFTIAANACIECQPLHREYLASITLRRTKEVREREAELYKLQDARCAICDTHNDDAPKGRLFLDHDHVTGQVRKLLCGNCNSGLGHFKDNPDLLAAAITYLASSTA